MKTAVGKVGLSSLAVAAALFACDRAKERERTGAQAPTEPGVTETRGAAADAAARGPEPTAESPELTPTPTPRAPARPLPGRSIANLPPFEGEVQMKLAGKEPQSLAYAMKGNKIRIGIGGPPGKKAKGIDAIIDTDDKTATVLLNDRREFVEIDLEQLGKRAAARLAEAKVEKTGKTDTVGGRECEQWTIEDRAVHVTACVVKGAPYFDLEALEDRLSFTAPAWLRQIVDAGYVPLRVSVADDKGTPIGSTKVSEWSQDVDASKFDIPVGYKKVDASKLPGAGKMKR